MADLLVNLGLQKSVSTFFFSIFIAAKLPTFIFCTNGHGWLVTWQNFFPYRAVNIFLMVPYLKGRQKSFHL